MASYTIEPPVGLADRIMDKIRLEQRKLAMRKAALFSFTFLASLIALFPAFKMLNSDMANSGFLSFSSLIFSDFSTVMIYWRNFGMAVLETLPAMSFAIFLAVVLAMAQSFVLVFKNTKNILQVT